MSCIWRQCSDLRHTLTLGVYSFLHVVLPYYEMGEKIYCVGNLTRNCNIVVHLCQCWLSSHQPKPSFWDDVFLSESGRLISGSAKLCFDWQESDSIIITGVMSQSATRWSYRIHVILCGSMPISFVAWANKRVLRGSILSCGKDSKCSRAHKTTSTRKQMILGSVSFLFLVILAQFPEDWLKMFIFWEEAPQSGTTKSCLKRPF